jgi:hypothetical protein
VVFEKSEKYKEYDRIVRIGTHTSDNRLKKRLTNHFVNENKDGSIFRKNIGLALLTKAADPYFSVWNLDTSRPEICTSHAGSINQDYQKKIEKEVTRYLQQNMTFVCIPVDQASDRLRLEEGLIASLNQSPNFKSSSSWLGLYNQKREIAESGLWNSQGLNGILLNKQEIEDVKRMVSPKSVDADQSQTQVSSSSQTRFDECIQTPKQSKSISTEMIAEYINQKLNKASHRGETYIDITSGDIHRELNLSNLMPSVCGAMRRIKQPQDQVLHTTKSGNSSTIKFRYILKGRSFKLFPKW